VAFVSSITNIAHHPSGLPLALLVPIQRERTMNRRLAVLAATALFAAYLLLPAPALAQTEKPSQPAPASKESSARVGDPYPLDTCPITGKKLGSMGDPVTKVYGGQEVRFCCPACPPKFEKDQAANLAKLNDKIIKDQGPLYPLKTSVVTGKDLPEKPFELVYGNRLVRLGAESEKAPFLKDAAKYIATLDKAAVERQGKDYPVKTCLVSKEQLGGDMGEPVDVVLAGRLIRLCCDGCKPDLEKEPAKFIALADEARQPKADKPADSKPDPRKGG
jgi:hypothetical protein